MSTKDRYSVDNVVEAVEEIVNSLMNGRQSDVIDPTQAVSLGVLLQTKALRNANEIRDKYIELGEKKKEYLEEYRKERKKLEETYDISKFNEKKVEEMCLQESEEMAKIQKEIIDLEVKIKGLKEETKYLSYLSKTWDSIITTIKFEWINAGK